MVDRIVMGQKSGRMGFWVTPPGEDASAEVARFTLNSDWDYLRFHDAGIMTITASHGETDESGRNWKYYDTLTIPYPDFGYIPLAFMGNSGPSQKDVFFPLRFTDLYDSNTPSAAFASIGYEVYSNKLVMAAFRIQNYASMRVTYMIFKNKVAEKVA